MKIETTIKPRSNGTVTVKAPGAGYVFAADEDGRMVADIADEGDLAFLLGLNGFLPADDEDFARAAELTRPPEEDFIDDGNVIGEVEDLDDDEPANLDAAPVEQPTEPKPAKKKK